MLLGLALAVFAWGLQYKLSLYDAPHSVAREIPKAKLLTGDQQGSESDQITGAHPWSPDGQVLLRNSGVLSLILWPAALKPIFLRSGPQDTEACALKALQNSLLSSHYFRPPPPLA